MAKRQREKTVATLRHEEASRKNIPTAEFRSVMERAEQSPVQVAYQRRNRDLDPQLVWRGKDAQDWSDLVVQAPPLFIQEKVHPKVLTTCAGSAGAGRTGRAVTARRFSRICSPTSTGCRAMTPGRSSISTTPTGRTG